MIKGQIILHLQKFAVPVLI